MKALMYADLCAVRRVIWGNALVSLLVVAPVIVASGSGAGDTQMAAGVMIAAMVVAMLSFFLAIHLFGTDETNDWQTVRLTMPFTAREVVRSRYASVACGVAALACMATVVGFAAQALWSLVAGGNVVVRGLVEVFAAAAMAGLTVLFSFSFSMPFVFRMGVSKARLAFSAPYLLMTLFSLSPVRDFALGILAGLESLERSLGTPLPLFAAAFALVAAVYLVSMKLSEGLYAARDF